MRTLGVSLVAIAAIVASLAVVKHRQADRLPQAEPSPDDAPAAFDLEGMRAAGF